MRDYHDDLFDRISEKNTQEELEYFDMISKEEYEIVPKSNYEFRTHKAIYQDVLDIPY